MPTAGVDAPGPPATTTGRPGHPGPGTDPPVARPSDTHTQPSEVGAESFGLSVEQQEYVWARRRAGESLRAIAAVVAGLSLSSSGHTSYGLACPWRRLCSWPRVW